MSSFANDNTNNMHHLNIETACQQSLSKQDYIISGKTERYGWILVLDGHGKNIVLDYLKSLNWSEIIEKENFEKIIFQGIENLGNTENSGSTISIVKIYPEYFECLWIGDSTIKIYCNNDVIFTMPNHDQNHSKEIQKIEKMNIEKKESWSPQVLSETEISMKLSYYFNFGPKDLLNMTHSLGHNNVTGKYFEKKKIPKDISQPYKILLASDGLWDMYHQLDDILFCKPEIAATEILDIALKRWKQNWNYRGEITKFPDGNEDDIAIGTCIISSI